jgi:hypothetical protein
VVGQVAQHVDAVLVDHPELVEDVADDHPFAHVFGDINLVAIALVLELQEQHRLIDALDRPDRVLLESD